MAEKPAAERTEQPTPRRIRKARKEGKVPSSMELPSALILAALLLVLWMTGASMMEWFALQVRWGLEIDGSMFSSPDAFMGHVQATTFGMVRVCAPAMMAIMAASLAASVFVSGMTLSAAPLKPKLEGIDPVKGVKQLFSTRSLVQLVVSIAKLVLMSAIVYIYIKDKVGELAALRWAWSWEFTQAVGDLAAGVVLRIVLAVIALAVFDVMYQKWKYIKDLKMTRQEVKEERKQDEGSPEVKRRIRLIQFEMVRKRMMKEVPKATVILVNPTHVAVALKYDASTMDAPIVVAKGGDHLCEKIKEIGRLHGVPIIRRPELARSLFSTVEAGQPVPENLFIAVAEILAMIYRLRKRPF